MKKKQRISKEVIAQDKNCSEILLVDIVPTEDDYKKLLGHLILKGSDICYNGSPGICHPGSCPAGSCPGESPCSC